MYAIRSYYAADAISAVREAHANRSDSSGVPMVGEVMHRGTAMLEAAVFDG